MEAAAAGQLLTLFEVRGALHHACNLVVHVLLHLPEAALHELQLLVQVTEQAGRFQQVVAPVSRRCHAPFDLRRSVGEVSTHELAVGLLYGWKMGTALSHLQRQKPPASAANLLVPSCGHHIVA